MKLEFVEFYPLPKKNDSIHGTLHIYIIDYKMDLRGVYVRISGSGFYFALPGKNGIDPETGKNVYYPVVCFSPNDKEELMKILKKEGKKFVKERIKSGELKFPESTV